MYKNITLVAFISAFMLTACGGGSSTDPISNGSSSKTSLAPVSSKSSSKSSLIAVSSQSSLVVASSIASSTPTAISSASTAPENFSSVPVASSSRAASSIIVLPPSSSLAASSLTVSSVKSSAVASSVKSSSAASSIKSSSSAIASSVATSSSVKSSSSLALSSSSAASSGPASIYHVRGTFNSWNEGTLMTRVGSSDIYELCANFAAGDDANGGPRFKVDPNGAWGTDSSPAGDYPVAAGWVKISYNSVTKAITTQEKLPANCAGTSSSSSVAPSSSSIASSSIKSSSSIASSSSIKSSSSVASSSSVRSSSSVAPSSSSIASSSVRSSSSIASSSIAPSSSSIASSSAAPVVMTHNAGKNCLTCHKVGGTGAAQAIYTVAGTIYKNDGSPQPNATVSFTDPGTSATITLKTDGSGNFYTTQAIAGIKTTGIVPVLKTATNTKTMPETAFNGGCNACHGVTDISLLIN